MKPRSFLALAALTLVVVIAAVVSVLDRRSLTTIPSDGDHAFGRLAKDLNAAAAIEITSSAAEFTIVKTAEGWGMKDRANYPVHFEKVKGALVGLAELTLLEAKTSDPARYERLQVEEPESAESNAVRFAVKDAEGGVIASGVIGKPNPSLFGDTGGGTYLRRDDEAQSWLAKGEVRLGRTLNDWLVRDIVNVQAEDVKRAVIRQPDGAEIVVRKDRKDDKTFELEGVPEGRKLKDSGEGKNLAGGLWRLSFEDVKPADEVPYPERFNLAEYETFDGLKVRVEMTVVDGDVWGRFSASAEAASGEEAADVKKRANAINARAEGWIYRLSPGEGERLTTKIEDILEKPKES